MSARDDEDMDICVMNADGSDVVRIDGANLRHVGDLASPKELYPSWSPEGDRLAFTSDRDGHYEIYVMLADGSHVVRLTGLE